MDFLMIGQFGILQIKTKTRVLSNGATSHSAEMGVKYVFDNYTKIQKSEKFS